MTWACLSESSSKQGRCTQLLSSEAALSQLCSAASLSFCPGLFDAVQSPDPPDVSFFESLPSNAVRIWGVYVIVLKKKNAVPLIYIGSGTSVSGGVSSRWQAYNRRDVSTMPRFVLAAFRDGYSIVHKGLLVFCPIPPAADVPMFRLLFLAMEATFSFLFWAMRSQDKDYGMSSFCPWPRDSLSYSGLCTHDPLCEIVLGNFDLSREQLEAMAAATKEKRRIWNVNYASEHRARLRAQSPEQLKERERKSSEVYRQRHPGRKKAMVQAGRMKRKASKAFHCTICNVDCESSNHLARHNLGKYHLTKVAKAESGIVQKHYCAVCRYGAPDRPSLVKHNLTERHLQRVAKSRVE